MSQHLVMFLIGDEDDEFKDQAALEGFAREVQGGFHQDAERAVFFQIGSVQGVDGDSIMDTVGDMIAEMQESFDS